MGVLDDAIREHLELKRKHGASDDEIARAEEEALTPARRAAAPPAAADLQADPHELGEDADAEEPHRTRIEPMHDPAPPPEATRAVHDIDEDPLPPPAPGHEPDGDDEPGGTGHLSD